MSITEWVADCPESFGRYSDNHKNGCTQENTFDRMPKIGIGQPKPKWLYHVVFQIVISNTFVHNHHPNQPKVRQRETKMEDYKPITSLYVSIVNIASIKLNCTVLTTLTGC